MPRRLVRIAPALWLLVLLMAPGVAWLSGARQGNVTNATKAAFPPINRSSVQSGQTFKRIDTALLDRLPLREPALQLKAAVSVKLFSTSPNPKVILGKNGWLFYRPDLQTCTTSPAPQAEDAFQIMALALVASGRTTAVVSTGTKTVWERQHVKDIDPSVLKCLTTIEGNVAARLRDTPGGLDLTAPLRKLERTGHEVFLRRDTHWTPYAREVYARAVLDRVRPGMAKEAGLRVNTQRTEPYTEDLAALLPLPAKTQQPILDITRTPRQPGPKGSVLQIGDSQSDRTFDLSRVDGKSFGERVLPSMVRCSVYAVGKGRCDAQLRAADVVILQSVARNLQADLGWCWRIVSLAGESLQTGRRGHYALLDQAQRRRSTLRLSPNRSLLRVGVPGGSVSATPRLIRLPVLGLPAPTPGEPASPAAGLSQTPSDPVRSVCLTPSQNVSGGALFIPIPPHADLSQMTFSVTGPAGARLGAPQEIALDGSPITGR